MIIKKFHKFLKLQIKYIYELLQHKKLKTIKNLKL